VFGWQESEAVFGWQESEGKGDLFSIFLCGK